MRSGSFLLATIFLFFVFMGNATAQETQVNDLATLTALSELCAWTQPFVLEEYRAELLARKQKIDARIQELTKTPISIPPPITPEPFVIIPAPVIIAESLGAVPALDLNIPELMAEQPVGSLQAGASGQLLNISLNIPQDFKTENGKALAIAVGIKAAKLEAWCVDIKGSLWRYNNDESKKALAWVAQKAIDTQKKVLIFKDISASSDGILVALGKDGFVYNYNWTKKTWARIDKTTSTFDHLSVGNAGNIWAINDAQKKIYQFDSKVGAWVARSQGIAIAAGFDGTVVGINAMGSVYKYEKNKWVGVPGVKLVSLAVGNKNNIWGVGKNSELWQALNGKWTVVNGPNGKFSSGFDKIAVNAAGVIFCLDADGDMYQRGAIGKNRLAAITQGKIKIPAVKTIVKKTAVQVGKATPIAIPVPQKTISVAKTVAPVPVKVEQPKVDKIQASALRAKLTINVVAASDIELVAALADLSRADSKNYLTVAEMAAAKKVIDAIMIEQALRLALRKSIIAKIAVDVATVNDNDLTAWVVLLNDAKKKNYLLAPERSAVMALTKKVTDELDMRIQLRKKINLDFTTLSVVELQKAYREFRSLLNKTFWKPEEKAKIIAQINAFSALLNQPNPAVSLGGSQKQVPKKVSLASAVKPVVQITASPGAAKTSTKIITKPVIVPKDKALANQTNKKQ